MTTFTLKLGKTIDVPVRLDLRDGAKLVPHSFTLVARRLSAEELDTLLERARRGEIGDRDVLVDLVLDWRGQTLVADQNDLPAAYSPEALDVMCTAVGVRQRLVRALVDEQARGLPQDEAARRGN